MLSETVVDALWVKNTLFASPPSSHHEERPDQHQLDQRAGSDVRRERPERGDPVQLLLLPGDLHRRRHLQWGRPAASGTKCGSASWRSPRGGWILCPSNERLPSGPEWLRVGGDSRRLHLLHVSHHPGFPGFPPGQSTNLHLNRISVMTSHTLPWQHSPTSRCQ